MESIQFVIINISIGAELDLNPTSENMKNIEKN